MREHECSRDAAVGGEGIEWPEGWAIINRWRNE